MIVALVKIGSRENILDSYKNEYLYFNTLDHFKQLEKEPLGRYDPHEGDVLIKQVTKLTVEIEGKKYQFHELLKKFNAQYHESLVKLTGNVCSFCQIDIENNGETFTFDDKLKDFGDTALIIFNLRKFAESLDKSLEQAGLEYKRSSVKYYDKKTYTGDLSFFHKENFFQYQREYRILINSTGENPIKIKIPHLKECSSLHDFDSLKALTINFKV